MYIWLTRIVRRMQGIVCGGCMIELLLLLHYCVYTVTGSVYRWWYLENQTLDHTDTQGTALTVPPSFLSVAGGDSAALLCTCLWRSLCSLESRVVGDSSYLIKCCLCHSTSRLPSILCTVFVKHTSKKLGRARFDCTCSHWGNFYKLNWYMMHFPYGRSNMRVYLQCVQTDKNN